MVLPASIAGAMHLIDQRIGNARGGLGFLTSAEILAGGPRDGCSRAMDHLRWSLP